MRVAAEGKAAYYLESIHSIEERPGLMREVILHYKEDQRGELWYYFCKKCPVAGIVGGCDGYDVTSSPARLGFREGDGEFDPEVVRENLTEALCVNVVEEG